MTGYSLDQLLTWCLEDQLIDDYLKTDEGVVITQGKVSHQLSHARARSFLAGIFGSSPYGRMKMNSLSMPARDRLAS